MTAGGTEMLGQWLGRAGFLLTPVALVLAVVIVPATFGFFGDLPIPGLSRAEADNPPLTVGLDTAFGVTRAYGLPLRTYGIQGDQLWVYEVRTETDRMNVKRVERGEVDLDRTATEPVTLERVSVLRFDGQTKLLKAVYLR